MSCPSCTEMRGLTSTCISTKYWKPILRTMHFSTASTPGTALAAVRMSATRALPGAASINSFKAGRSNRHPFQAMMAPATMAAASSAKARRGPPNKARVMPGVGEERNALQRTRFAGNETKEQFLDCDDGYQNVKSEGLRFFPVFKKSLGRPGHDAGSGQQQHDRDRSRRQRLRFAVAVGM